MNIQTELSKTSVRYLEQYHKILEDMICGMHDAELTDSISHNFIVQMIPHHKAAIEMSVSLLKYTTWIPLQNIAENIIMEQRRGVANMKIQNLSNIPISNASVKSLPTCFTGWKMHAKTTALMEILFGK